MTRSALQHAASIAGMVLTTETLVTDLPEEKPEAAAAGMHTITSAPCQNVGGGLPGRQRERGRPRFRHRTLWIEAPLKGADAPL
jgi:hypothetical protein